MTQFIDRRLNGRHKGAVNRQRFIARFKNQLKQAVSKAITERSITDIEKGEDIHLPKKEMTEPRFQFGKGGKYELVLPYNQSFIKGDKIKKPQSGTSEKGSQASNKGEGLDPFSFQLTREEFLELFFDDLELPNLVKTQVLKTELLKKQRQGFTIQGTPSNINVIRSLKGSIARKFCFKSSIEKKIKSLEKELQMCSEKSGSFSKLTDEIERQKKRIKEIPFIDPLDLRYNYRVKTKKPATQAVMFCLMDVSGSMDEAKKEIAKRFFILLYLFLKKTYDTTELVFIRHHTLAKEVDESQFFYSRETGGTVVSSALDLMQNIIKERYRTEDWNIYGAQASDGDNWNNDSPRCKDILLNDILPFVQYFAYVEILPRHHQSLWEAYKTIETGAPNFAMQTITEVKEIYPVFRDLFKRRSLFSSHISSSHIRESST